MPINKIIMLFILLFSKSFATTDLSAVQYRFLSNYEAGLFLSTSDDYIQNLSVLDLSLYHSTKETISILEHLDFLKTTPVEWTENEKISILEKIKTFNEVASKLELKLDLPKEVQLIKTNGKDAFNSHYTRLNAIIFPANNNGEISTDLATVYHEMFHIFSRNNAHRSDELFNLINFKRIKRLLIPSDLEKIRTTNPDAFFYDHSVTVKANNQEYEVVPVMYSAIKQDEINGPVNEALVYKLGLFEQSSFNQSNRLMFKVAETNYKEVVMANSHYYIHPEEIMAENFKLLLLQNTPNGATTAVKYQKILDQLKEALKN